MLLLVVVENIELSEGAVLLVVLEECRVVR